MVQLQLEEIPEWIESNIKQRRKPEADPDEVVSVLRQTARRLNDELEAAPEENLFRNVLGATPEDDEEEKQAARETAGFLLVNQITFYRVLSANKDFPEIDPETLQAPADLADYFDLVLEQDYTPVFSFKMVKDLPQESLPILRDAVKSIYALSPERINHDILGKVFHELIPVSARKKVAAYYTKNKAADILTSLAIQDGDDRVMDPACGSGTLLASSYMRKRQLTTPFTEEDHRRFVEEEITGIDVMPFAAHLSCIHLALQAPIYETDEVNIGIADSTELKPGDTLNPLSFVLPESEEQRGLSEYNDGVRPDISKEEIEGGSTTIDAGKGSVMQLDSVDLVVMNPPFSRQESVARFSPDYKSKLETRFDRRNQKGHIHGKMSYCSYFFFLADKFLEQGGRMAVVVPATVLNKKSDNGVREMLVNEYDVEYVFAREDEPNYSEDTDLREVLIIARKDNTENDGSTAFVSHDGFDISTGEIQDAAESTDAGDTYYGQNFTLQQISIQDLNINNLFAPFSVTNPELITRWEQVANELDLTTLDTLDVGLIRGIGSNADGVMHVHPICSLNDPNAYKFGDEDLFVLAKEEEDHVVARHRHTGETFQIPRDHVVPNLRRYSGRKSVDLSNIPEYVILDDNWDGGDRYVALTDEDKIHRKWSDRVQKRRGHIALVRRVDLTAPGTHHLAYYSDENRLYPDMMWVLPDANQEESKVLTIWFDSTFGWLQSIFDRIETRGGWIEWHKYIVQKYRVPQLHALEDRSQLLDTFKEVKSDDSPSMVVQLARNSVKEHLSVEESEEVSEAFDGLDEEIGRGYEPRRKLDKAVLTLAGMNAEEQDNFLDEFYTNLLVEIVALKLMME